MPHIMPEIFSQNLPPFSRLQLSSTGKKIVSLLSISNLSLFSINIMKSLFEKTERGRD